MNSVSARIEVTRLTARARGAVAVLRIETTDDARGQKIDRHFTSRNGIAASDAEIGRILYGDWGSEDVVVVRIGPRQWEVNCHGGEVAVGRITEQMLCDDEPPIPAIATGDLIETIDAELLQQLLSCRTRQTANYILTQQQSVLPDFLRRLAQNATWESCRDEIAECLRWTTLADHLTEPWQVAIVGRPNAGKSSLLNAIVGFDRSIVFDQPGTTRDRVEAEVVLDGWPFLLADTAGIRQTAADEIESVGVESAKASLLKADACLLVIDAVVGWTPEDHELLRSVREGCPHAIVFNKIDLAATSSSEHPDDLQVIETSAVDGSGIAELVEWLPQAVVRELPSPHAPLPLGDRVKQLLKHCQQSESLEELRNLTP